MKYSVVGYKLFSGLRSLENEEFLYEISGEVELWSFFFQTKENLHFVLQIFLLRRIE